MRAVVTDPRRGQLVRPGKDEEIENDGGHPEKETDGGKHGELAPDQLRTPGPHLEDQGVGRHQKEQGNGEWLCQDRLGQTQAGSQENQKKQTS